MHDSEFITMPFGKYRDKPIHDIPSGYLSWLLCNVRDLDPWLRQVVTDTLRRRQQDDDEPAPRRQRDLNMIGHDDLRVVIRGWFRRLTAKHHPDRFGDPKVFAALTNARDELLEALQL